MKTIDSMYTVSEIIKKNPMMPLRYTVVSLRMLKRTIFPVQNKMIKNRSVSENQEVNRDFVKNKNVNVEINQWGVIQ